MGTALTVHAEHVNRREPERVSMRQMYIDYYRYWSGCERAEAVRAWRRFWLSDAQGNQTRNGSHSVNRRAERRF